MDEEQRQVSARYPSSELPARALLGWNVSLVSLMLAYFFQANIALTGFISGFMPYMLALLA